MKTLIIYDSKHGSTEGCARQLAEKLTGETKLHQLGSKAMPDLSDFDQLIIGSPIYMGQASKKVKAFCETNAGLLLEKPLGLYVCGMADGEAATEELHKTYSSQLIEHALAAEFFGGAFNFDRMNFFERFIIKKVSKSQGEAINTKKGLGNSIEKFRTSAIDQFAKQLNERDRA